MLESEAQIRNWAAHLSCPYFLRKEKDEHKRQAEAIIEALSNAQVGADSIGYIETHGSGTPAGDPVEIRAFTESGVVKSY